MKPYAQTGWGIKITYKATPFDAEVDCMACEFSFPDVFGNTLRWAVFRTRKDAREHLRKFLGKRKRTKTARVVKLSLVIKEVENGRSLQRNIRREPIL
jgi:hypothetical protein